MAADENFLSRWSRRKTRSRTAAGEAPPQPVAPAVPATAGAAAPAALPASGEPAPLPPVESLTPESDFAPFMAPEVDGDLRRKALKTLFGDPRFNVMDMMDVYVDDYSKPDPLPDSWLAKMDSVSWLGDKGGRDREEAERRKALAQEQATGDPARAAGAEPDAAEPPGEIPVTSGSAMPGAEEPEASRPEAGIPVPPVGESGT